jgi:hypothetical protein
MFLREGDLFVITYRDENNNTLDMDAKPFFYSPKVTYPHNIRLIGCGQVGMFVERKNDMWGCILSDSPAQILWCPNLVGMKKI